MLKHLKPKNEFSQNVLTLMTGTTISQAIPIAISPILTRLYSPEDFGLWALFISITSIFGSVANGRYELAIMLPEKDEDAINIFALGFIITSAISLILFIIVLFFNDYISSLLNNNEIRIWLYFVPMAVFFIGLYNILNYFNNRQKKYKDLAKANIIKSITTAIVQLSLGFIKSSVSGLIGGQIGSYFVANTKLLKNILKDKVLMSKITKVKIIALAKRYKNFPKFSMWAVLANTLSRDLTNILISTFFSVTTLGFYSLVQRLLGMPSSLIGNSISQVFFQEATKEKQQTGRAVKIFSSTVKKLIIIGLPCFGVLFFIVEDLFVIVFGEEWRIAGTYAKIVTPLFFIRFISSTLSIVMTSFEKQKFALWINILLFFSATGILILSNWYNFIFYKFLYISTYVLSMQYILFLLYYYKLAKGLSK